MGARRAFRINGSHRASLPPLAIGGLPLIATFAVVLSLAPLGGAAPASAAVTPVEVPGTFELYGVTCTDEGRCIAVGLNAAHDGVVVPFEFSADGATTVGSPQIVPHAWLHGVACADATRCIVVGENGSGIVVPLTRSADGGVIVGSLQVVSDTFALYDVACPAGGRCAAVGWGAAGGLVVPIVPSDTGATSIGLARAASEATAFSGVACPGATDCVAVGVELSGNGSVVPFDFSSDAGPVFGVARTSPSGTLYTVACPTFDVCEAAGDGFNGTGAVVPFTLSGGEVTSIGPGKSVFGTFKLEGLACPSASACEAVGDRSSGASVLPVWISDAGVTRLGAVEPVADARRFHAVACPSAAMCVAVGTDPAATIGTVAVLAPVLPQPPAITSAAAAAFTAFTAGSFTVTATGRPAPSIRETGTLPPGLSFVDRGNGQATLAGTPGSGSAGTYDIRLEATNGFGPDATQAFSVSVGRAVQEITFTSAAPSPALYGGSYSVAATGGASGNSVTFSSAAPSVCELSDSTARFVGIGSCTIDAAQEGNEDYLAAPARSQTFAVEQAPTSTSASRATVTLGFLSKTVRMSAKLTSGVTEAGIAGQTVTFRLGSRRACSAVTDEQGTAGCSVVYGALHLLEPVPSRYTAAFGGSTGHLASSGTGTVEPSLLRL